MQYKAFISYSHAADGQFAPALQSALHRFAKPYFKLRAMQVFRDQTDLSANPALWPVIKKALEQSEYLLLLASPESAKSKWVKQEIDHWLNIHEGAVDKLLIVLTGGILAWDSEAGDFDWSTTNALPPVRGRFNDEPLYVDQRWAKTEKDLSLRNPRFLDQVATIAATLHGKSKSEMIGEDVREHKKYRRARTIVATMLLVFAVVASGFAIYANQQRKNAESRRKLALSRQLAAQALNYLPGQVDLALLLAIEANQIADTMEARSSLLSPLKYSADIGTFLHGPGVRTQSISFSSDRKLLASGSSDNSITLWNLDTRQPSGEPLKGHTGWVNTVAFNPDGTLLASGGRDNNVILWDIATRTPIGDPLTAHSDYVWSVAFSPDGKTLVSSSADKTIILWDVQSRRPLGNPLVKHKETVFKATFSPDGKTLASCGADGSVILWNLASRQPLVLSTTDTPVNTVVFSPNGKMLAASDDKEIRLWDVATHQLIREPLADYKAAPQSISFNADSRLLASGHRDGTVIVWDVLKYQKVSQPLTGLTRPIDTVAFNPDGTTLGWAGDDKRIGLLDVQTLHRLDVFNTATTKWAIALSSDGKMLAVSDTKNPYVALWDVGSRRQIGEPLPVEGAANILAFSPDGKFLVVNGSLWDLSRPVARDSSPLTIYAVKGTAFSPDSKILALGWSDGSISLIDVASNRKIGGPIQAHAEPVFSLAFSPDGKTLASGSRDKTIRLWDVATRTPLGSPLISHTAPVYALTFNAGGTLLASGGADGAIILWDIARRGVVHQLIGHTETIRQLAFSPDDKTLASTSDDTTCILWDVASGQQQVRLVTGGTRTYSSIAFTPNGEALVTGRDNIIFWDVSVDAWKTRGCKIANRNLSGAEWIQHFDEPYHKTCPNLP